MKSVQNRTARGIQDRLGAEFTVLEFETPTRSANEAALAIGCTVDHIAKSLVFCTDDGEPVLVIVSGASRVDERKVSAQLGKAIHRADAQFVRDKTGFSIGGVLPLGHRTPPVVMINVDDALGEWVDRQLTPQPVMTVTQPIQLTGRHISIQQKVYIRPKGITRPSLIASSKSDLQTRRGILS